MGTKFVPDGSGRYSQAATVRLNAFKVDRNNDSDCHTIC